jgi:hypothetical protein
MAVRKTNREDVIKQLRKLIASTSGKRFLLAKLPDNEMFGLYQHIRSGTSLNDCATWLMKRSLLKGSHDSCRKMVSKFRARIAPLLIPPPRPEPEAPELVPLKAFRDCGDLEQVSRLVDRYAQAIDAELTAVEQGAPLNPTLAKHSSGLAALLKQKERLQAVEATKVDESKSLTDHEKAVFQRTVGKLQDGGEQFCAMAKAFISACEDECVELDRSLVN